MSLSILLIIAVTATAFAGIAGWLFHRDDFHDRSDRQGGCIVIAGLIAAVVALASWAFLAGAALIGGTTGQIAAAGLLTVLAISTLTVALRVRDPDLSDNLLLPVAIILPAAVISWCLILGTVLLE